MIQRTVLILYILALTSLYGNADNMQTNTSNSELAWVDSQVNAILPPRKGISNQSIDRLKEPFVFVHKVDKNAKTHTVSKYKGLVTRQRSRALRVMLIINSKAMINGRWYKQHDRVRGYKISSIERSRVVLKKRNRTKILSVHSDNKNIKINMK
jgi:hypothetical protein